MKKDKQVAHTTPKKKQQDKSNEPKHTSWFFCEAEGHDLVCSKENLTSALRHTWWIDYDATTHISTSI